MMTYGKHRSKKLVYVNLEEIYGDSMIYADEHELNNMALTGVTDRKYVKPNKNLVLYEWWKKKVF